jgi:hypothetical protein
LQRRVRRPDRHERPGSHAVIHGDDDPGAGGDADTHGATDTHGDPDGRHDAGTAGHGHRDANAT